MGRSKQQGTGASTFGRGADRGRHDPDRRRVLAGGAAGVAMAWLPVFRVTPGHAAASCAAPKGFPAGIDLYQQAFENWSGAIKVDDLWTCAPRDTAEILAVADWAAANGYRLRARGSTHNWSPLHITGDTTCEDRIVMVSTREHMNRMSMVPGAAAVRTQPGALMDDLLAYLEEQGYGMTATPAPGELTVGGVLAIDGHGAATPALGEGAEPGKTFGSVSNRVQQITVVQWDDAQQRHRAVTYDRMHPHAKALICNLGRIFVTEVVLQVGANFNLRCVSRVDIDAAELFGAPGAGGQSFTRFLDEAGRAEAIWFPFTEKPWFKVWSVAPTRPLTSREVSAPYNYPFSDQMPEAVTDLAAEMVTSNPSAAEVFGPMMYNVVAAGLAATASYDIWGPSKNTLLYVRPDTLRITANGYAVITSRANVQHVLHQFYRQYTAMMDAYRARGEYPANMPVEIRCTGLDSAADVDGAAEAPSLSAIKPVPGHPEWDVAVWFDVLALTHTPGKDVFYTELEDWFLRTFDGTTATMRPEWSKGWAYTVDGAWTSADFVSRSLPALHATAAANDGLDWAARIFNAIDPHRVFTNPFVDRLLP